jgi:hypothetical protein
MTSSVSKAVLLYFTGIGLARTVVAHWENVDSALSLSFMSLGGVPPTYADLMHLFAEELCFFFFEFLLIFASKFSLNAPPYDSDVSKNVDVLFTVFPGGQHKSHAPFPALCSDV